jgi:hypothetical protein
MTYANDCIGMLENARKRKLKRIELHSDTELNTAIEKAFRKFGEDFWLLLHGVDAYMERRKRREKARAQRKEARLYATVMEDFSDVWGNS